MGHIYHNVPHQPQAKEDVEWGGFWEEVVEEVCVEDMFYSGCDAACETWFGGGIIGGVFEGYGF